MTASWLGGFVGLVAGGGVDHEKAGVFGVLEFDRLVDIAAA